MTLAMNLLLNGTILLKQHKNNKQTKKQVKNSGVTKTHKYQWWLSRGAPFWNWDCNHKRSWMRWRTINQNTVKREVLFLFSIVNVVDNMREWWGPLKRKTEQKHVRQITRTWTRNPCKLNRVNTDWEYIDTHVY